MAKRTPHDAISRGDRAPLTCHLDGEARKHLDRLAPGHTKGMLVSRLIFEYVARQEAKAELQATKRTRTRVRK
jgi:hypothetical protein